MPLIGKGKQKQITGTFSCTKSGIFLPIQLIYQGKSDRCHPREIEFPDGCNITHTPNHLSNEDKAIEHLESIIFPFVKKKKEDTKVTDMIEENDCVKVFVPANLTHEFQPLDLTVNGVAKEFLNKKFGDWYAKQITDELEKGTDVYKIDVNTTLTVMKPVHAKWVIGAKFF